MACPVGNRTDPLSRCCVTPNPCVSCRDGTDTLAASRGCVDEAVGAVDVDQPVPSSSGLTPEVAALSGFQRTPSALLPSTWAFRWVSPSLVRANLGQNLTLVASPALVTFQTAGLRGKARAVMDQIYCKWLVRPSWDVPLRHRKVTRADRRTTRFPSRARP